jgi:hypothetical protein
MAGIFLSGGPLTRGRMSIVLSHFCIYMNVFQNNKKTIAMIGMHIYIFHPHCHGHNRDDGDDRDDLKLCSCV